MIASNYITSFNNIIKQVGGIGSLFTGSAITSNDYGDATITYSAVLGSMYVRPMTQRELAVRPEGERTDGRVVAYIQSNDSVSSPGSIYEVHFRNELYRVVSTNDFVVAGSLIYTRAELDKVNQQ